jgi:signal transduction histidine kinase
MARSSIAGMNAYQQLIAEVTHHADAERRSWRYYALYVVGLVIFSLSPLVPGTEVVFGAVTPSWMMVTFSFGVVASFVCVALYRRFGPDDPWYQRMEMVEAFLMYGGSLALIVLSGVRGSPLYSLSLFTGILWALTKPFLQRQYGVLVALAHGLHAAVAIALGRWGDAAMTVCVGLVAFGAYVVVAHSRRNEIFIQADRNVARAKMQSWQLDRERERIARSVTESVTQRLAAIIEALKHGTPPLSADRARALEQARLAHRDLNAITSSSRGDLPATLGELSTLIESSVKPLCVNAQLTSTLGGDAKAAVVPATALAATRIAQELVRNAITHGAARTVDIDLGHDGQQLSLRVSDDGLGMTAERIASSTGGLRNVQRWASECGGSFHRLSPAGAGTTLSVTLRDDC